MQPRPSTSTLTIVARDPGVLRDGQVLLSQVEVPYETLSEGPRGCRLNIIDVDTGTGAVYRPHTKPGDDPFQRWYKDPSLDRDKLLADPRFHQQNAYAIAMRTLGVFERALGRRVPWGFAGHQLRIAPHAFIDANAFYSRDDEALLFGYFEAKQRGRGSAARPRYIFTALSHDVVAHETTHAIVDGLRPWYLDPSSADQGAFHEAFADVVAILSVFSLPEIVGTLLERAHSNGKSRARNGPDPRLNADLLKPEELKKSILLAIGNQMGEAMIGRDQPLRRSAELPPATDYLSRPEFQEAHRRGEVLVAAVLYAFLHVWTDRLSRIVDRRTNTVSQDRAVDDGAGAAERLLRSSIRALDYAPPVDLTFSDFLSALLTADREIHPQDDAYRRLLRKAFAAYGIKPVTRHGYWDPPSEETGLEAVHFDAMQRDPTEVFRFIWENRTELNIAEGPSTQVTWVRPCIRVASDGFVLRETVAEYVQRLTLRAEAMPTESRPDVPSELQVDLVGGGTLVFNEFGALKYHVQNRLFSKLQKQRVEYLWRQSGVGDREAIRGAATFSDLHRRRMSGIAFGLQRRRTDAS